MGKEQKAVIEMQRAVIEMKQKKIVAQNREIRRLKYYIDELKDHNAKMYIKLERE